MLGVVFVCVLVIDVVCTWCLFCFWGIQVLLLVCLCFVGGIVWYLFGGVVIYVRSFVVVLWRCVEFYIITYGYAVVGLLMIPYKT